MTYIKLAAKDVQYVKRPSLTLIRGVKYLVPSAPKGLRSPISLELQTTATQTCWNSAE